MPYDWTPPELLLEYRGVRIYHAYKDDFMDIPLGYFYTTSESAPMWSGYEFDVRDLPGYDPERDTDGNTEHARAIRAAIDGRLLRAEEPCNAEGDV